MTPREPDRYDKQGEELACAYRTVRCPDRATLASQIAAALRAEAAEALERAAQGCESMVVGGRAWTEGQAIAADALFAAARQIRALIPPAAAPAAETGKAQRAEARPFNFAEVAANDLLQVDRRALQSVDPEKRRKLAAKLLAGLAAEVVAPPEREGK